MTQVVEMVLVGVCFLTFFALAGSIWFTLNRKIPRTLPAALRTNAGRTLGLASVLCRLHQVAFNNFFHDVQADGFVFNLAPFIIIISSFMAIAVIPFAKGLQALDFDIGIFYVTAVSSIGVVSILADGPAQISIP